MILDDKEVVPHGGFVEECELLLDFIEKMFDFDGDLFGLVEFEEPLYVLYEDEGM